MKNGWWVRDKYVIDDVEWFVLVTNERVPETGKIEVCLRNLALIAEAFDLKAWQLLKF